jgi:hypothetical protein
LFLTLLKRAVKAALHDAGEELALESGLPQEVVKEMRAQRLAFAARAEATADTRAALALGVAGARGETRATAIPPDRVAFYTSHLTTRPAGPWGLSPPALPVAGCFAQSGRGAFTTEIRASRAGLHGRRPRRPPGRFPRHRRQAFLTPKGRRPHDQPRDPPNAQATTG